MGKKLTQRDKIMLLVLLMVLVVALALVLPTYGVLACTDAVSEYESKTAELDDTLSEQLSELVAMGVSEADAESMPNAKKSFNKKIEAAKREAAMLAGSIMAYSKAYGVDDYWLNGLEYEGSVETASDKLLFIYDKNSDVTREPNKDITYNLGAAATSDEDTDTQECTLRGAERTIKYTVATQSETEVLAEYVLEGFSPDELGAIIIYMQQLRAKGSILVSSVSYDITGRNGSVSFTVLMTSTENIENYAQEIAEKDAQTEAEQ